MSATAVTLHDLRRIDLFDDLDDDELAKWVEVAQWHEAEAGGVVIEGGHEPDGLICLLEGILQMQVPDGQRLQVVGRQTAPTWIGAVPTLTEAKVAARMIAVTDVRWALIPAVEFRHLVLANPDLHQRIMRQVGPVVRRITEMEQNRERLAALGTMAAGLAHELNNPAAAARSAAGQLSTALQVIGSTLREFVQAGVEREDAARIADLRDQAVSQAAAREEFSGLEASDAVDDMLDRLEAMEIGGASQIAEPLALAGVDQEWLDKVQSLAGPATPAALRSVAVSIDAQKLVDELCESTQRMSSLVGAVKAYAYMDRGGVVKVDIHEGLDTTLTILHHKLKHTKIAVKRQYDRSLPQLMIYGSELNQVWTNLLVNAIQALGQSGTITIATERDGDCVLVNISDDGPGIPEDVRERVFEPFFTTKGVGEGTGLGLDTAKRIVEDRHGGSITFDTGEHGTSFHVWLPIKETEKAK